MATLTVTPFSKSGVALTGVATGSGTNDFVNTGHEVLFVKNASGSQTTVTVTTPAQVDGLAVADLTVNVPQNSEMMIGPFAKAVYNTLSTGKLTFQCAPYASVTVAVFKLTPVS